MSAELAVRDAVIAAMKADGALMDGINGLFDGPPDRASAPYMVVGECITTAWGAGQVEGCELRLSMSLHAPGPTPGRLAPMLGRIDPVLQQLDRAANGWRIMTARLLRSRIAKTAAQGQQGWQAAIDYRIRAVREA